MKSHLTRRVAIAAAGIYAMFFGSVPAMAQGDVIGMFTAVQGQVAVTHPGATVASAVKLRDDVLFKDVIETQRQSRAKALFQDDSILSVAEGSRVEVAEHIYDPTQNRRSMVVKLIKGRVRALVGQVFGGAGSKFEVHTPTAVAAARGTYFVVWIEEGKAPALGRALGEPGSVRPVALGLTDVAQLGPGATGIANIGSTGSVAFTSSGQTVLVNPGQFSVALPGTPPSPPVVVTPAAPPAVSNAIQATAVKDAAKTETPKEAVRASGGSPAAGLAPAGPPGGVAAGTVSPSKGLGAPSAKPSSMIRGPDLFRAPAAGAAGAPIGMMIPALPTVSPPPAVISGAAPASVDPAAPGASRGRGAPRGGGRRQ